MAPGCLRNSGQFTQTFANNRAWIYNSPVLLWLDPAWDPIRQDPRFQALLKQYAKYKPAVIPDAQTSSNDVQEKAGHG